MTENSNGNDSGDRMATDGHPTDGIPAEERPTARGFDNSRVDMTPEGPTAPAGAADAGTEPASDAERSTTLNEMYDHLRHSQDPDELRAFAQRPLPDRSDAAAFSRATALLEAVAGNLNTPVDTRIALAEGMPFPNILVKLSQDPDPAVRRAVAGNENCKNWLAGRLTKDEDGEVREAALHNGQTSWRMLMEGAEDPRTGAQTLDFLASKGTDEGFRGPAVLATMVRRAVALNPTASAATLERLAADPEPDVSDAARSRLSDGAMR